MGWIMHLSDYQSGVVRRKQRQEWFGRVGEVALLFRTLLFWDDAGWSFFRMERQVVSWPWEICCSIFIVKTENLVASSD
jgi:hypothetical protein